MKLSFPHAVPAVVTLCLSAVSPSSALADLYWQPEVDHHAHHHGRGVKRFSLVNMDSDRIPSVHFVHSDLISKELELSGEAVNLRSTGKGNYHALVAKESSADLERSAIRFLYFNGRPVDTSPSDLLAEPLASLQLIPDPLPREHWKYESLKNYQFKVVFNGELLTDHPVLATTGFGSNQILHTDSNGILELMVPDDFEKVIPKKRATPPGEFRLFTSYEMNGKQFETSLSSSYQASSEHWKSTGMGAFVVATGLLAGFAVNRRLPSHNRRKSK